MRMRIIQYSQTQNSAATTIRVSHFRRRSRSTCRCAHVRSFSRSPAYSSGSTAMLTSSTGSILNCLGCDNYTPPGLTPDGVCGAMRVRMVEFGCAKIRGIGQHSGYEDSNTDGGWSAFSEVLSAADSCHHWAGGIAQTAGGETSSRTVAAHPCLPSGYHGRDRESRLVPGV